MPNTPPAAATPPVTAAFRFYEELNDFLAPEHRRCEFETRCARAATVKHMIEALGVPHTEVELVLVNGESVGFDRLLRDGDRVSVYPRFETFDITPLLRVRPQPLRQTRFIAVAHLGGLAHLLRLTGFDTLYDNGYDDPEIVAIAEREGRIALTRDRELLKRRTLTHGCFVHLEAGAAGCGDLQPTGPRPQRTTLLAVPGMQCPAASGRPRRRRTPPAAWRARAAHALLHL